MRILTSITILVLACSQLLTAQIEVFSFGPGFAQYFPTDMLLSEAGDLYITGEMKTPVLGTWPFGACTLKLTLDGDVEWQSLDSLGVLRSPKITLDSEGVLLRGYEGHYSCQGDQFVWPIYDHPYFLSFDNQGELLLADLDWNSPCDYHEYDSYMASDSTLYRSVHYTDVSSGENVYRIECVSTYAAQTEIILPEAVEAFVKTSSGYFVSSGTNIKELNDDGDEIWSSESPLGMAQDLCEVEVGNFLILDNDGELAKVDPTGETIWEISLDWEVEALANHGNGNYILVGRSDGLVHRELLDFEGNVVWTSEGTFPEVTGIGLKVLETPSGFATMSSMNSSDADFTIVFDEPCIFSGLSGGCTNPLAINFDSLADCDDGTCEFTADGNNDGIVNTYDLLLLLMEFGCDSGCDFDLNGDGTVNTGDLLIFIFQMGG